MGWVYIPYYFVADAFVGLPSKLKGGSALRSVRQVIVGLKNFVFCCRGCLEVKGRGLESLIAAVETPGSHPRTSISSQQVDEQQDQDAWEH